MEKDESVTRDDSKINFASHFSEFAYLASQVVNRRLVSNDAYQLASEDKHETIKNLFFWRLMMVEKVKSSWKEIILNVY